MMRAAFAAQVLCVAAAGTAPPPPATAWLRALQLGKPASWGQPADPDGKDRWDVCGQLGVECGPHGRCVDGLCRCSADFGGADCR